MNSADPVHVVDWIGSWWLARETPLPGEVRLWSLLASRLIPPGQTAIGRLFVTTHRMVFCPIRLDHAVVGGSWAVARTQVGSVVVEPPAPVRVIGLPTRSVLRVQIHGGRAERFLVFAPRRTARRLNEALGGQRSPSLILGEITEAEESP